MPRLLQHSDKGQKCGESFIPETHNCSKKGGSRNGAALTGASTGFKAARNKKMLAVAATAAGAAAFAAAALTVRRDLQNSQIPDSVKAIRTPPDGKPDKKTLEKYDSFEPGSLVRKQFTAPGWGRRYHYGVYVGKDESGNHMIVESDVGGKEIKKRPVVKKSSISGPQSPNSTEYEMVPEKEMWRHDAKKIAPDQAIKRAESLVGKRLTWDGFDSNCESLARSIVEGTAYAAQGDRVSRFTTMVAKVATLAGNGFDFDEGKVALSGYWADRERMSARQISQSFKKDAAEVQMGILDEQNPKKAAERLERMMAGGDQNGAIKGQLYKSLIQQVLLSAGTTLGGPQVKTRKDQDVVTRQQVNEELKDIIESIWSGQVLRVMRAEVDREDIIKGGFRAIPQGQTQPRTYEFEIDLDGNVGYQQFNPRRDGELRDKEGCDDCGDDCECSNCSKRKRKPKADAIAIVRGELLPEEKLTRQKHVDRQALNRAALSFGKRGDQKFSRIVRATERHASLDAIAIVKGSKECGKSHIPKDHDCHVGKGGKSGKGKQGNQPTRGQKIARNIARAYAAVILVSAARTAVAQRRSGQIAETFNSSFNQVAKSKLGVSAEGMTPAQRTMAQMTLAELAMDNNPSKTESRDNHALSTTSKWNSKNIDKAMDGFDTDGARERFNQLREIQNHYGIQAVFRSTKEKVATRDMDDGRLIRRLNMPHMEADPAGNHSVNRSFMIGANGYTAFSSNHVVVVSNSDLHEKQLNVDPKKIQDSITKNLKDAGDGKLGTITTWGVKNDDRAFVTYLHEMGHQIDAKTGGTTMNKGKHTSRYGKTNPQEWFAEAFVHYMVDKKAYEKFDPDGARYIERKMKTLSQGIQNRRGEPNMKPSEAKQRFKSMVAADKELDDLLR